MSDNENAVQDALMKLLEVKLDAWLDGTKLSDGPAESLATIRAAYFTGVSAGISLGKTIRGDDD